MSTNNITGKHEMALAMAGLTYNQIKELTSEDPKEYKLKEEKLNRDKVLMLRIASLKEPNDTWNQTYEKMIEVIPQENFTKNRENFWKDFCQTFKIKDLNSTEEISPENYIRFLKYWIQGNTLLTKSDAYEFSSFLINKDILVLDFLYSTLKDRNVNDDIKKRLLFETENNKRLYRFTLMTQEIVDFLKLHPDKEQNVMFEIQQYHLVNDLFFTNKALEYIIRMEITEEIFYYLMDEHSYILSKYFTFHNYEETFSVTSRMGKKSFPLQKSKLLEYLNNKDTNIVPIYTIGPIVIENAIIDIKKLNPESLEKLILSNNDYIYSASYLLLFKQNDYLINLQPIKIDKRIIDDGILDDYPKEKLSLFIDDMDEYAKSVLVTDELILMSKDEKRKRLLLTTKDLQEYIDVFLELYLEDKVRFYDFLRRNYVFSENTVNYILKNFSGKKLNYLLMLETIAVFPNVSTRVRFYNLACIKLKNENYPFSWDKNKIIVDQEFEENLALNGELIELLPMKKRTLKLLRIAYKQNPKTLASAPFWLRPLIF